MSKRNQQVGRWGENAAAHYLHTQGYVLLGQNLRTPHGEIDLLLEQNGVLVFVEVKTRTSGSFGHPEEAVTPGKLEHMQAAALYILEEKYSAYGQRPIRFDVIAISGRGDDFEILHIEDVQ